MVCFSLINLINYEKVVSSRNKVRKPFPKVSTFGVIKQHQLVHALYRPIKPSFSCKINYFLLLIGEYRGFESISLLFFGENICLV